MNFHFIDPPRREGGGCRPERFSANSSIYSPCSSKAPRFLFYLDYSGFPFALLSVPMLAFQEIVPSPNSHAPIAPLISSKALSRNLFRKEKHRKKRTHPHSPLSLGRLSAALEITQRTVHKKATKFPTPNLRSLNLFDQKQPFLKEGQKFLLSTAHTTSTPGSQEHFPPKNLVRKNPNGRVADGMRGKLNLERFVAIFRSKILKRSG